MKKAKRNQILGTLGAVASIISLVLYFAGIWSVILSWIRKVMVGTWHHLISPSGLPFWLLYSLILSITLLIIRGIISWAKNLQPEGSSYGPHLYWKDEFFGVKWRWQYISQNYLLPEQFVPFCPHCDLQLVLHDFGQPIVFYCDNCRKGIDIDNAAYRNFHELEQYMIREVQRRIRSGEWKDRLARQNTP